MMQYAIALTLITWIEAAALEELKIGMMETYKQLDHDSFVFHMEEDLFKEGNIVFSDRSCVKTTNGTSLDLVVGQCANVGLQNGVGSYAQFNIITGFSQINRTFLVATDYHNNCLRSVNRVTNETNEFMGDCSSESNLGLPYSVKFFNNKLYISYHESNQIRVIDWNSKSIVHEIKNGLLRPSGMCFLQDNLVTSNLNYLLISNLSNTSSYISAGKNESGFKDGKFNEARFYYPSEIVCPSTSAIFVADHENNKIRLLDINLQTVSSICDGTGSTRNGDSNTCQLDQPISLLLDEHVLYVGQLGSIRKITVFKAKENMNGTTISVQQSSTTQNQTIPMKNFVEEPLAFINWHIIIPISVSTIVLLILCAILIGYIVKKNSTGSREQSRMITEFDEPLVQHQKFRRSNPLYHLPNGSSDASSENGESHQYEECRSSIPRCHAPDRPYETIRSADMTLQQPYETIRSSNITLQRD